MLADYGFTYAGEYRRVAVFWKSDSLFFSVSYLPETGPRYVLQLAIGRDQGSPVGPQLSGNSVGIWRLLPVDIAPKIADWRFDRPRTLTDELRRAWTDAVVPYEVLYTTEHDLVRLIAEDHARQGQEAKQIMDGRLLRYARAEFEAGRLKQALGAYGELPADLLTRTDRKRIELARRHV